MLLSCDALHKHLRVCVMTQPSSLEAAHKEIDRLKSQVSELDRKLSQLQVPKPAENGSHRQAQSAFDVLTGSMPKSRSTAALDRLNASTELLGDAPVPMATTRVVMHQVHVNITHHNNRSLNSI